MFSMKVTGLDALQRTLSELEQNARNIQGTHNVPLGDLLTPSYLSQKTRFPTLDALMAATGKTDEEFLAMDEASRDSVIRSIVPFDSWQALINDAASEWTARQLGL